MKRNPKIFIPIAVVVGLDGIRMIIEHYPAGAACAAPANFVNGLNYAKGQTVACPSLSSAHLLGFLFVAAAIAIVIDRFGTINGKRQVNSFSLAVPKDKIQPIATKLKVFLGYGESRQSMECARCNTSLNANQRFCTDCGSENLHSIPIQ